MSGLQTVKLTLAGSPITLIGIDTDLLKECQGVLERYFSRKSPAFSEPSGDESAGTLGPFQIVGTLAVDAGSATSQQSQHTGYLSPSSLYYPVEIETNAAVFTDEIDKFRFSPPTPESRTVFAPVIAEVRSLNPTHHDDLWPNRTPRNEAVWLDSDADPLASVKLEPGDWDVPSVDGDYTCPGCDLLVPCSWRAKHNRDCGSNGLQCRECGWHCKDLEALEAHKKDRRYRKSRRKHLVAWLRRKGGKPIPDCLPRKAPKKRKRRAKGQPYGRLAATLRSRGPPVLLPFDTDAAPDMASDPPSDVHPKTRPRDPLSVPQALTPTPTMTRRKQYVSVLSDKRFASVTSPGAAPKRSRRNKRPIPESPEDVPKKTKAGTEKQRKNVVVRAAPVESRPAVSPAEAAGAATDKGRNAQGRPASKEGRSKVSERLYRPFQCKTCDAGFWAKRELVLHQRQHRLQCKYCQYRFLDQFYLSVHQKIFHPETVDPGDVLPPEIPDSEGKKSEGSTAEQRKRPASVAGFDSRRSESPDLDLQHLLSDESGSEQERSRSPGYRPNRQIPKRRLFACTHCPMRCANGFLLRKHVMAHSATNRIECPTCHKIFRNERTLAAHVEKTHGVEITTEDVGPLPCKGCNAQLASPLRLAEHYCTTHINLALLGCGICRTVLSLAQWRTHASTHI